jgi:DNA repair protein RecO (recombination protein O)
MRYFTTEGIILKKKENGESNHYLTIYSPEIGKFNAVSKGTRRMASSKGHLDPMNIYKFQLYRTGNRDTLVQCQQIASFPGMMNSLEKSLYGMAALEIFEKICDGTEDFAHLFQSLINVLKKIEFQDEHDINLNIFKLELLKTSGALPSMAHCYYCGKKWNATDQIRLDTEGHLSCNDCLISILAPHQHFNGHVLSFGVMKLMHFLSTQSIQGMKLQISSHQKEELWRSINIFLQNYLHTEINSEKILRELSPV